MIVSQAARHLAKCGSAAARSFKVPAAETTGGGTYCCPLNLLFDHIDIMLYMGLIGGVFFSSDDA